MRQAPFCGATEISLEADMNMLSLEEKTQVISALVEGNSIRSTERMTGVHRDTIMRLLLRTGENCQRILDEKMQAIRAKNIQVDEIWTFVAKKQKHVNGDANASEIGDQYVFVALDADTKLIPTFAVGKRDGTTAYYFMEDLQRRLAHRVQLTTDGFSQYINAVDDTFGTEVDYAQLIKVYSGNEAEHERYSPSEIIAATPKPIMGRPNPWLISTSFVERQNLTIRMQLRRFTRLTNAFSKKLANLKAALSLHFAWYNFCRVHSSLRVTPAMAAAISNRLWDLPELFV
jgi:IS1 family transposase